MTLRRAMPVLPGLVTILAVIGAWQLWTNTNHVSVLVLPSPSAISSNLTTHWSSYLHDARITFDEAFLGFSIALVVSIALAATMVHFRLVRQAVDPLAIGLRCLPVVALAPGLAIWLGFGILPKVIVAALITFPPFLVNLVTGYNTVDVAMLEVLESVNASRWEIFRKLRIPNAWPYLFSAMKVCTTLALIGAVVGEWSNSSEGLGYRIVRAQSDLATVTVWGAIVVLALMGLILTLLVTLIERRSLRWLYKH
jgi:NitT/TauT family transport system permease protein